MSGLVIYSNNKRQKLRPCVSKSKTSETKTDTGEYLLYDSDKQILTNRDIKDLSFSDLRKARNEILARHGRMFKDTILQNYFSSKSWYKPSIDPDEFDRNVESYLNDIEIKNVEFIKSVEDKYNSNTEGYSDEELKKKVIAHYKSNYVGEGVEEKILANAEDYIYNGDGTDLSYREIRSMGQDVIAIYLVEDDSDKNVALAYPEIPWNYYIKRSTGRGKIINWRTNEIKEVDINGY